MDGFLKCHVVHASDSFSLSFSLCSLPAPAPEFKRPRWYAQVCQPFPSSPVDGLGKVLVSMIYVWLWITRGFSGYLTLTVHFLKASCCIYFTTLSFGRNILVLLELWQSSNTHTHPELPLKLEDRYVKCLLNWVAKLWHPDVLIFFHPFCIIRKGWNSCPMKKLSRSASRSLQIGFIHCFKPQVWHRCFFFSPKWVCWEPPHAGEI